VPSFVGDAARFALRAGAPPNSLIGAEFSLFRIKKSLFRRVGILICKARKTQENFDPKIAPEGRFCGKSL
jgi:hypothetical protein